MPAGKGKGKGKGKDGKKGQKKKGGRGAGAGTPPADMAGKGGAEVVLGLGVDDAHCGQVDAVQPKVAQVVDRRVPGGGDDADRGHAQHGGSAQVDRQAPFHGTLVDEGPVGEGLYGRRNAHWRTGAVVQSATQTAV